MFFSTPGQIPILGGGGGGGGGIWLSRSRVTSLHMLANPNRLSDLKSSPSDIYRNIRDRFTITIATNTA